MSVTRSSCSVFARHAGLCALTLGSLCAWAPVPVLQQRPTQAPPAQTSTQTPAPTSTAAQPQAGRGQTPGQHPDANRDFIWWNDDSVRKELNLTPQQVRKINDLYDRRQTDIRPYVDEFNKQQTELDRLVRERQVEDSIIALQAARIEAPRAHINESRIVLLYRISRILTVPQNDQLRAVFERRSRGRGGH